MGEVVHELVLGIFAIEVHAKCRLGSIESISGLLQYSSELSRRLERLQQQLDIEIGSRAQNYRFATWAARQNERMIEAIDEHQMPIDATAKARLHAQAYQQHEQALKLADEVAAQGVGSDMRRAAELLKHDTQMKRHKEQTWPRGI